MISTVPPIEAVLEMEELISRKKSANKSRKSGTGKNSEVLKDKPRAKVRDHDSHVLICSGGDCKKRGAKDFRKALKSGLRESGMIGDTRLDTVDCLGLCKHGPNAVVYGPNGHGGTWYLGLTEDDAPEIVDQHLAAGEPVERLAAERRPRKRSRKK